MNINVLDISTKTECKFVAVGSHQKRLWITEPDTWYRSVGWCPHYNIGSGECTDCSLVLETDDER